MACERYRDALTDVAAGEPATAAVEAHLASCEACRAELHALRRTLAVADAEMAGLASAEPSPGLAARIRQAAARALARVALRLAVAGGGRGGHAAGGPRGGAGAGHRADAGAPRGSGCGSLAADR